MTSRNNICWTKIDHKTWKGVDKVDSREELAKNKAQANRKIPGDGVLVPDDKVLILKNRVSVPRDAGIALKDNHQH